MTSRRNIERAIVQEARKLQHVGGQGLKALFTSLDRLEEVEPSPDTISVESGVSHLTGEGFVQVSFGDFYGQLSPDEARDHAAGIVQCAEAAEFDAIFVHFMESRIGVTPEQAAGLLNEFRQLRSKGE